MFGIEKMKSIHKALMYAMNDEHLVSVEFVHRFNGNIVKQLLLDGYIKPCGEMYEVYVYPTAKELKYDFCKGLGCAVALRAAKDFFDQPESKEANLRALRSPWLNMMTEEMASRLATTLETNPNQVRAVVYAEEE